MPATKPGYVDDQSSDVLLETDDPRTYLQPQYFRPGRTSPTASPVFEQAGDAVGLVSRTGRPDLRRFVPPGDGNAEPMRVSRVAITTDAGLGKSAAVDWLLADSTCRTPVASPTEIRLRCRSLSATGYTEALLGLIADRWSGRSVPATGSPASPRLLSQA